MKKKFDAKKAGIEAARLLALYEKSYQQYHALLKSAEPHMAPFPSGTILSRRDELNRLQYFMVWESDVYLIGKALKVRVYAARCTRTGERRGSRNRFDLSKPYEVVRTP